MERLAIFPFENLTGDSAVDWIAAAAPAIVAYDMVGVAKIVPIRAPSTNDGYLAGADRFVHGFFTRRGGGLQFEIQVEDAARHKMIARAAEGGGFLDAMNALAKRLDPGAHPFSTSSAEAVSAWGHHEFERAVAIDPDFGAGWLAWIEGLSQKSETAQALAVADRALARPVLRSEVDRARIAFISASLRQDSPARERALSALVKLDPLDTGLLATAAETEIKARNFGAAVGYYKNILRLEPENAEVMNSLGYADSYAGDLDAARRTLEDYGKQPGQKTNSLDSIGEVHFMHGRFADAEKYFLAAQQSGATGAPLPGGSDLMKAAYAHWLGGDLKGADAVMTQYLDFRRKAHDPLVAWREASWDYATGRPDLAIRKVTDAPQAVFDQQMAAWNGKPPYDFASRNLSDLKRQFEGAALAADGQARTFYASALLQAGRKDEARKLLELWPLPGEPGDIALESTVFPKFIELRRAVGLPTP